MERHPRKVTVAVKKQVASIQRFICAANISGYVCPLKGKSFDEAGYDIDHIVPLSEGGTNDVSNLQALCVSCHRVKTLRASVGKTKPKAKKTEAPKKKTGFVYTGPTLSDLDSDEYAD